MLKDRKREEDGLVIHPQLELDIGGKPWKRRKVAKKKHFKILTDDSPNLMCLGCYDSLSWMRTLRNDKMTDVRVL